MNVKVYLVTGLIGSGKSEVCRILSGLGYPVYECDSRTKALYSPELVASLEAALGVPYGEFGVIFTDPSRRRRLEDMVYPLVRKDLENWLSGITRGPAFVESANASAHPMFADLFDEVVEVYAGDGVRFARNPDARLRSAVQSRPSDPDRIIVNDGSLEDLRIKTIKTLDLK